MRIGPEIQTFEALPSAPKTLPLPKVGRALSALACGVRPLQREARFQGPVPVGSCSRL